MDDTLAWHQANVSFPDWDRAEQTGSRPSSPRGSTPRRWSPPGASSASTPAGASATSRPAPEARPALSGTSTSWPPRAHHRAGPASSTSRRSTPSAARRPWPPRTACSTTTAAPCWLTCATSPEARHRREISLMLCSVMMRAARQDWFEQGDIWARVADHRKPPARHSRWPRPRPARRCPPFAHHRRRVPDARRQRRSPTAPAGQPPTRPPGRELAGLAAAGRLHRGLRDVLAHHVIFAWNRLGLSYETQSALAGAAKTVVFGPDPAMAEAG